MGPVLFRIFIIDQESRTECILSKFAVHTKLREEADTQYVYTAIYGDLDELEK